MRLSATGWPDIDGKLAQQNIIGSAVRRILQLFMPLRGLPAGHHCQPMKLIPIGDRSGIVE